MMDACGQVLAVLLLVALSGCAAPSSPPRPEPPYRACLAAPPKLPAIATVEQVRARHDQLDKLYLDCAERLRRTVEAVK